MQVVPPTGNSPIHARFFRPGSTGRSSSTISALWIAMLLLVVVHLAGCGVTYNTLPLTVSPSSLTFGSVQIGKSQTATVTLQNPGLTSVTLSGAQAGDPAFTLSSDQANTTIAAGASATVKVTFAPTAAKDYSSQVVIASGSQQTKFPVTGTGQPPPQTTPSGSPALAVSSNALQFGSVPIGGNAQQTLTITSSGTAPLDINALNASGSGFSAQMPSLPLTLQPGQSLALPVAFVPKTSGAAAGQLVIGSNAANASSVTVNLAGDGASSTPAPPSSATPALTLSSTSVDFGSVAAGSQGSNSVTLTSSGTAAVVIQTIAVSGSGFSIGNMQLPLTLAPGQQVALPITFAPTGAGAQQGEITLTDNATGSPNSISLTGTGTTSASLSVPQSVEFGDVTVGSAGSKTITLVSNGTAPVTIESITVAGASFSGSPQSLPQVLQPNQQLSLKLKFSPEAEGDATGTVTITSDAAASRSTAVKIHGKGIGATVPALSASATTLSFGQVAVGSQAIKTVTVTSTGTAPATISAGSITGTGYTATYAGVPVQNLSAPLTLQPGQQVSFDVVFDPSQASTSNGQLSLSTNTGSPVNVSLSGTGIANTYPALTLSAPSLDFGDVEMGSQKVLQLTLTSSGTAPVTVSSSAVAGNNFQITSTTYPTGITNLPATLNPGQQIVLSITFSPNAVSSFTGNVALTSNASGGTANVPLSGTGDAVPAASLALSATSINFGQVQVGSTGTRSLTLTSSGNAPLNIIAITVSGAQFSATPSLPVTLQPNQQLTLTLTYAPTAEEADSGTLTIASNDPSGPATVSLGGSGTVATSPQLTVNPTAVSFGNEPLNSPASQTVTLTSSGTAALTITAASVTGSGFSVSGVTFPITLNPNQTATLQVQFDPTSAGAATGQLTVSSNATGGTVQVPLSGTGTAVATTPQLTVSAGSLSFGNVAVSSTATLPLTLTSTGTAPVTISAAAVSGAGFADSGVTFPITLNPNQTATLNVQFAPAAAGAAAGQLTITSNSSSGATTVVQLSGTGTVAATPTMLVSATSLAFGSVSVNSTSTLSLTLTSTGTAPLTINSATISGTGFSDSGATFPVTLNPNQAVTVQVQFDPTAAGAVTGQLTISSNSSSGATTQVQLSGTGAAVQHYVDLSWNAPASSSDPVAGYNVYRSTDGGSTFTQLNSSADTQVSYTDNAVQSGTTYVYEVKSVDANGVESSPSNLITLSVP